MNKKADFNMQSLSKVIKRLFIFLSLLFTPLSWAKIHIEPYAGWSFMYASSTSLAEETFDANSVIKMLSEGKYYAGPTAGMRLGYSSLGLAVGADFTFGKWESVLNEDSIKTPALPGLFISYKLPLLFRAYATLIPYTHVELNSKTEDNLTCKESRGAKFGISYLSLPFISVNFEYMPLHINGANCSAWAHAGAAYVNFIF